ncbi:MAG: hypothetical protein ACTSP6_09525 [Promethearchaeota archaeon]
MNSDLFIQLVKNINDYIILNERELVKYLSTLPDNMFKRTKKGNLNKFEIEDNSLKRRRDPKILSVTNLQLISNLGNKFLINKVLKNFNNPGFKYESERVIFDIRKVRYSIKKWFNYPKVQIHLDNLLEFFEETIKKIDKTIIDMVLWKFDDYMEDIISATSFTKKLERYKDYLTTPKNWFVPYSGNYFEFSSLFNFTTHMLFIEYYINTSDKNKLVYLKEDVLNILFEHMIDLGVFNPDSLKISRIQFTAIAYTLYISTVIKIKKNQELIQPSTIRKYIVNLPKYATHLSLGENYFPGLFKKKSVISRTTALDILKKIKKNQKFCAIGYEEAVNALESLISLSRSYIYRSAYVGILSHGILEEFFMKKLIKKGFNVENESLINTPNSLHRADLLINALNDSTTNLPEITEESVESITVDFTLTTENKYIIDKTYRNYQRSDRMLYIVLYSEDRNKRSKELKEIIENTVFSFKEKVRVLTLENFCMIFNLSNKDQKEILEKLKLFYEAIKNDDALEKLECLNLVSLKTLDKFGNLS